MTGYSSYACGPIGCSFVSNLATGSYCYTPLLKRARALHARSWTWQEADSGRYNVKKKGRATPLDLKLGKELKSPAFKKAFQRELSRTRLADQITNLREKLRLTQSELARKVGTTQSGIARIENPNYTNYSLKTLEKVAHALGARLVVGLEENRRHAA